MRGPHITKLLHYFLAVLGLLPSLIVLAACVIFLTRRPTAETLVMLIARIVALVTALARVLVVMVIAPKAMSHAIFAAINNSLAIISSAALLVFAFALLRLAQSLTPDD